MVAIRRTLRFMRVVTIRMKGVAKSEITELKVVRVPRELQLAATLRLKSD